MAIKTLASLDTGLQLEWITTRSNYIYTNFDTIRELWFCLHFGIGCIISDFCEFVSTCLSC